MKGRLFIVSGSSGSGKTSLVTKVVESIVSFPLERVITYTTKKPRSGEMHAKDYYFITEQEFQEKAEAGFFLEWSNAYGAYYGSPRSIVDCIDRGVSQVLIADKVGVESLSHLPIPKTSIWINVGVDQLQQRLMGRSTESQEEIQKRIAIARAELSTYESSLFDYSIDNNSFEEALQNLVTIFIAEHAKKS